MKFLRKSVRYISLGALKEQQIRTKGAPLVRLCFNQFLNTLNDVADIIVLMTRDSFVRSDLLLHYNCAIQHLYILHNTSLHKQGPHHAVCILTTFGTNH